MLSELDAYYESQGIAPLNFRCVHYHACSANCAGFAKAKAAFVSTGYEQHDLPRVLFLSLDPAYSFQSDAERSLLSVRRQEEVERDINSLHQGRHWYRTHELAYRILSQFKPSLRQDQAKHYFAHTNSCKCSMNNPGHKKAKNILFENCRKYIPGELGVLDPEVLITQGGEAKDVVESQLRRSDYWSKRNELPEECGVLEINGRPVMWIHNYHPNNYGKFKNNYKRYEEYARLAYMFIQSLRSKLLPDESLQGTPVIPGDKRGERNMNENNARKLLIDIVKEINTFQGSLKITFNQQARQKKNMSFCGGNGRLWVQPVTEGYDVSLSGKSLEKQMYGFMSNLCDRECDGYKQTNMNKGKKENPFWRVADFDKVRKAAYYYAETNG
jgi:hypothetical protein